MNNIKNPKLLLLIDAFGALVTTILLFFVVRNYHHFFGIDPSKITTLAIIAFLICCYSMVCNFVNKKFWKPLLFILASFNLLYCLFTVVTLYSSTFLTIYGILYFFVEIVIISVLALFEIKTARRLHSSNK
ncbi:hypothetical protein [Chryseobacterium sp. LAM-KRS1]|uniref:hypothetical protein n=1 Tax=Chryseobacterium sp. LAM-KRS1 TaxID=2715754 RepID=UPI00155356C0|nr:hypothetical protein [Chryseobacterium sp. LAM-KRS1]